MTFPYRESAVVFWFLWSGMVGFSISLSLLLAFIVYNSVGLDWIKDRSEVPNLPS